MIFALCLLFLTLPFLHNTIFANFIPLDVPLMLLFLLLLPLLKMRKEYQPNKLDALILIYAIWMLASVVVGSDSLYESGRTYRWVVFTPSLLYFVVRFVPVNSYQIKSCLLCIAPGALYQGGILGIDPLRTGLRPTEVEGTGSLITLAIIFSICIVYSVYLVKVDGTKIRLLRLGSLFLFIFFLYSTMCRGALFSIVFLLFVGSYLWKSKKIKRTTLNAAYIAFIAIMILVFSGLRIPEKAPSVVDLYEKQSSYLRVIDIDVLVHDINERLFFWGIVIKKMKDPFWGEGLSERVIGQVYAGGFGLGSAHNFLLSTLLTSGFPNFLLLIIMIKTALEYCMRFNDNDNYSKFLFICLFVTIIVGFTNDLSSGRWSIMYLLLALVSKFHSENIFFYKKAKNSLPGNDSQINLISKVSLSK